MTEIVINTCYGGFDLSSDALDLYATKSGRDHDGYGFDIPRDDPHLVAVVRELGAKADGMCASLKVVEIPNEVEWEVKDYDGVEWVAEKHRTWS